MQIKRINIHERGGCHRVEWRRKSGKEVEEQLVERIRAIEDQNQSNGVRESR